jgi:hypothetical protein
VFDKQDDREILVAQIDSLRDYIRSQSAEIAEMKNVEMFILNEIRRREREIAMIFSSRTYRVGRIILAPAFLLRGLYRKFRSQ